MADRGDRPLVTIGIPSYNYGRYLRQAVESALGQDYPRLEVLVADNGSTDDSLEVLASLRDSRLTWWRNERNLGMYPSCDRLVRRARGEYFKILPADDYLEPAYVSRCVGAMEQTGADFALPGFRAFGAETWQVLPSRYGFAGDVVVASPAEILRQLAGVSILAQLTPGLYRSSLVPEGFQGDSTSWGADLIYWSKAVARGRVVFVNQVLLGIRVHEAQARRARDSSAALADMYAAFDLLRPLDPGSYVDEFERTVSRTYGRSVLANLLRGNWVVARRMASHLRRRGRLGTALLDAIRPRAGRR